MKVLDLEHLEAQFGLMIREKKNPDNYALIRFEDLDKGITGFSKLVQSFGGSMDQLTREIDSQTSKDNDNLDSVWGKSENFVPIWSISENSSDSQSHHKANLEKIWGKKK